MFDKRTYQKDYFMFLVATSDWSYFYEQNCPERMFSVFMKILENALRKWIKKKKVFIRNDKRHITINKNGFHLRPNVFTITYLNKCNRMTPNTTIYNKNHLKT